MRCAPRIREWKMKARVPRFRKSERGTLRLRWTSARSADGLSFAWTRPGSRARVLVAAVRVLALRVAAAAVRVWALRVVAAEVRAFVLLFVVVAAVRVLALLFGSV